MSFLLHIPELAAPPISEKTSHPLQLANKMPRLPSTSICSNLAHLSPPCNPQLHNRDSLQLPHVLPFLSSTPLHRRSCLYVQALLPPSPNTNGLDTSSNTHTGFHLRPIPIVSLTHHSIPQVVLAPPASDQLDHLYPLISYKSGANFLTTVCDIIDNIIGAFLDPRQLPPSIDPKVQLSGNFAPVRETSSQRCVVRGVLPSDLNGVYIRNGPNATRLHAHGGHHVFDGDGMLHAVRIKHGTATYCCRQVRTNRFVQEEAAGRPLFPKFFGGIVGGAGFARTVLFFIRAILGLCDMKEGCGLANTSVAYFNGKVLAMSEDDMPYAMQVQDDGDLQTIGKLSFSNGSNWNMCAHPKFSPLTGEMFAFSVNPFRRSFSYFRVSAGGVKSPDLSISLSDTPMVHDFAITEKYVVFLDNQLAIRPLNLLRGVPMIVYDKNKSPRFCILPRYAEPNESEARWFDVPGFNCIHYFNAWDEGDEVVLITSVLSPPDRLLELPQDSVSCTLTEVRLHTKTGAISRRKICSGNLEFGTYNQSYTGRKIRYAYMANGSYPKLSEVVKVDLGRACIVARREYPRGCYGSEPFFVPRSRGGDAEAEDCGYVLSLVHNEETGECELFVMDAESPSLKPVAVVKLPSRVPYGFHGCFIFEEQLSSQTTTW